MSTTPPPPPPPASAEPPVGHRIASDHPRATIALVLGILGIVTCQVVAPFALVIGRRAVKEIDASNGAIGGRGLAQAGYILGIIGTVLLGLAVLVGLGAIIVVAADASS
jgi:hypothetical protein